MPDERQTMIAASAAESGSDGHQTQELLADLSRLRGRSCSECAAPLCGHETLMSLVVGCKDRPRCLTCLSRQMGRQREDLRDRLLAYIQLRVCRRAGWEWSSAEEGFPANALPECLWPAERRAMTPMQDSSFETNTTPSSPRADAEWDAGALGCGELVMGLRQRLMALPPRGILKLTATDAGMPEDLPAWCRLTGHILVLSKHPEYWIERREN